MELTFAPSWLRQPIRSSMLRTLFDDSMSLVILHVADAPLIVICSSFINIPPDLDYPFLEVP